MNKQKIVALSALTLAVLGGVTVGLGAFGPSLIHAQIPATQVQQIAPEKGEVFETQEKESVEASEPANEQAQEKNLPGGVIKMPMEQTSTTSLKASNKDCSNW